jgi:protoporphyrinogen IX oxidase
MTYGIVKSLHIISVIAWMAGLLYLPRLFVYHSRLPTGSDAKETFVAMERRLLKAIMLPAMLATWVFGLWLAVLLAAWSQGWLHAKIALVILLSAIHGLFAREARRLAEGGPPRAAKFYRILNEVPTLIAIAIVFLVVLKPF